eukprot:CAMPEP_0118921988 /NCGR_PEP_ID=MMETSP1169-20130426/1082_1 /TAXON_ID=36882 /ORGANISM="Pyramimonas obovata, Strain CCMP722" /LENGTH=539 /DNA_ID=CAMNT_0006862801 /DNA_START=269 /DNA_END=1884 /DNA_ORIENTATION=-
MTRISCPALTTLPLNVQGAGRSSRSVQIAPTTSSARAHGGRARSSLRGASSSTSRRCSSYSRRTVALHPTTGRLEGPQPKTLRVGQQFTPRIRSLAAGRGIKGRRTPGRGVVRTYAADGSLINLGTDLLVFLAATVAIVPVSKRLNVSPILGFLFTGFALDQLGVLGDEGSLSALSELGVLFLLFEMGLELSSDRLKALAKYAFVLGSLQIIVSTACFTAFELPEGNSLGSKILEVGLGAPAGLVTIRSATEALVIGAGLSLSSSAFVLQLLSDKGQLSTRFGSATLGILLMQDIAVVPLLVLLPLIEAQKGGSGSASDMLLELAPTLGTAMAGLTALLLVGRVGLKWAFDVVMSTRSHDAFVALCLLTVCGTSVVTTSIGLSDTLGAFLAGVLLAETNFRSQVEADMRPFRALLLGLFFLCTGTEVDMQILKEEWPNVLALTAGLIGIKAAVITGLGPTVGLTRAESVRTGFILSQGGEFAFVVFTLANNLQILPEDLNQLLIVVVILSMALTPALSELGDWASKKVEAWEKEQAEGG